MKVRSVAVITVISAMLIVPTGASAQLRGLLKKAAGDLAAGKAADKLKGKSSEPEPSAAPAPADPPAAPAGSPSPGASATTALAPVTNNATTRNDAKPATSPLDISQSDLTSRANQVFRELTLAKAGDWDELPYIPKAVVDAAKALDEPARVAFVEKIGSAFKALVMSDAFATAHAAYIKEQRKAVDHGIKGAVSMNQLQQRGDMASLQVAMKRQIPIMVVQMANNMSAADIQRTLADDLPTWRKYADDPKRSNRAKYQGWVRQADALVALGTSDLTKLRRGYAVLRSDDMEGPNTEEALYTAYDKAMAEDEQAAWDEYNYKTVLKRYLTAFVALVPTVDFAAPTVQKGGRVRFATPAIEAKGAVWKACFRAGKAPSMAALQVAQAWLKEL